MNQSDSRIENPSWEPFNKNVGQSRDQTITSLVGFYFSSIIVAVIVTTIQIWLPARLGISGISKDILAPLVAAVTVTFSYVSIKDKIAAEFDAGTKHLENEFEKNEKILEDNQKILEQIDKSTIKYALDFKYIAYIKPIMGFKELPLSEVSSKLTIERGENVSAFEKKLDKRLEESKNIREVRYKIHSLTNEFLEKLAFGGIMVALGLKTKDANERMKSGNDLHFLSLDIYAYLSAWLICSIDNDTGTPMSIDPIGMRYTTGDNLPDKETYKNVIQVIKKIIVDGNYKKIICYQHTSDPLSSDFVKCTIVDYLDKLINLIKNYPI
jgi:hypothetical protein